MNDELPKILKNGKIKEFNSLLVDDLTKNNGEIFGTENGQLYELENWKEAMGDYKKGKTKKILFKLN